MNTGLKQEERGKDDNAHLQINHGFHLQMLDYPAVIELVETPNRPISEAQTCPKWKANGTRQIASKRRYLLASAKLCGRPGARSKRK